jgi:partitioning defective protein 3
VKVLVAFGEKRVVVPCGEGQVSIRELVSEAVRRYRKTAAIAEEVEVRAIESSDGALFDMDDLVCEVAEDKDLLVAVFEERMCHIGDGASESASHSDMHSTSNGGDEDVGGTGRYWNNSNRAVSADRLAPHRLYDTPHSSSIVKSTTEENIHVPQMISHQQSAAHLQSSLGMSPSNGDVFHDSSGRASPRLEQAAANQVFRRTLADNSPRQTTKGSSDMVDRWISNQVLRGTVETHGNNGSPIYGMTPPPPPLHPRQEPVGSSYEMHTSRQRTYSNRSIGLTPRMVNVANDHQPLGIQVVAQYDKPKPNSMTGSSVPIGLLVRHVDQGGKADMMNLLNPGDLITDINNTSLQGLSFERAQEVFKTALQAHSLSLKTVPNCGGSDLSSLSSPPPATPSGSDHEPSQQFFPGSPNNPLPNRFSGSHLLAAGASSTLPSRGQRSLVNQNQPLTPPPFDIKASPLVDSPLSLMGRANTKKIGRKIRIQLTKGPDGLGLTLTTRDNAPVVGQNTAPVCIKKILPKGAAIQDGRLVEGDRLLEVNGVQVSGMTQADVVAFLRGIAQGEVADILISRHEREDSLPRQMPPDCTDG